MDDIKLLMVDLDETILMEKDIVSEKSKETVEKLLDNNVEVVWTTGRYFNAIPEYFINNKRINYISSSNGALIKDNKTKENIFSQFLSKDTVLNIIKLTNAKARHMFIFTSEGVFADPRLLEDDDINKVQFFQTLLSHITVKDDLYKFIKENDLGIKKVEVAFDDLDFRDEMLAFFKSYKDIEISSSHYNNIEAVSNLASKGNSLEFFQNKFNLEKSQTMAIGDNINDLSMIKAAGIGVAMDNASPVLKENADLITDSIENEGFSKAIEKIFKYK